MRDGNPRTTAELVEELRVFHHNESADRLEQTDADLKKRTDRLADVLDRVRGALADSSASAEERLSRIDKYVNGR